MADSRRYLPWIVEGERDRSQRRSLHVKRAGVFPSVLHTLYCKVWEIYVLSEQTESLERRRANHIVACKWSPAVIALQQQDDSPRVCLFVHLLVLWPTISTTRKAILSIESINLNRLTLKNRLLNRFDFLEPDNFLINLVFFTYSTYSGERLNRIGKITFFEFWDQQDYDFVEQSHFDFYKYNNITVQV